MKENTSAVRKIHFCYGHRVMAHESKCRTLHGHNGILWVYARPKKDLDTLGRVIDFSVLKERAGGWVDKFWDHTTILHIEDEQTIHLVDQAPKMEGKEIFIMPNNPTAENMADYFLNKVCPELFKDYPIEIHKVVMYETENCYVECSI